MKNPLIYIALCCSLLSPAAIALTPNNLCSAQSTDHIVPLIELYTSEGCSSCPPADQWLSGLADQGLTSEKVIPLAFHVDYWDYIGWKDRFASPKFTARQRQVVEAGRAKFAYTPQVLFNGIDFGDWRNHANFSNVVLTSQKQQAHTKLSLTLSHQSSGELLVASTEQVTAEDRSNAEVYFAVYENNLTSSVDAGENSGRNLSHNNVVRELYGPYSPDQHSFTLGAQWRQRNAGIVSFVQDRKTGQVLQALDRPFCITQ